MQLQLQRKFYLSNSESLDIIKYFYFYLSVSNNLFSRALVKSEIAQVSGGTGGVVFAGMQEV